jgi:DNA-binding MarR family transcriptional regulator
VRLRKLEGKERMVLEAMKKAGKPVRPGDVAEMTGLPKDEVSKVIKSLKKKGKVGSPKRCFWAPTE